MKNILKNFLVTLTRFKMASTLNIVGLAIAFAVFAIIMMQTQWEMNYNHNIADHNKIVRIETNLLDQSGGFRTQLNRPLGEAIGKSSPTIVDYCCLMNDGEVSFKILNSHGEIVEAKAMYTNATPSFPQMFGFEAIEGNLADMTNPDMAIIDDVTAKRCFGEQSAIGKSLFFSYDTVTVCGVYKALPDNCTLRNGIYTTLDDDMLNVRGEWSYTYYLKTADNHKTDGLHAEITAATEQYYGDEKQLSVGDRVRMMPLEEIYFYGGKDGVSERGNRAMTSILVAIAMLVILIAIINFINFFMAMVPIRLRSVNINKIFGTPTRAIRLNIVGETLGIVLLAFALSLVIIEIAARTPITNFVNCSLSINNNLAVIGLTALLAFAVGILSGIYPAYYITKFSPILVLSGSFGRTKAGQRMRMTLVTVQFVISIALIITSMFIGIQTRFMRDHDMGFNSDRLLSVNVGGKIAGQQKTFLEQLKQNPDIEDVAYSNSSPVDIGMGWGLSFNGEKIYFTALPTSWNYPEFMGIKLVEGRYFIEDDASKTSGTMIINETAAKKYGIKLGDRINGHNDEGAEVVGIAHDFNFRSMKYAVEPIVLYEFGSTGWRAPSTANIRISKTADFNATAQYIAKVIKQLNPNIPDNMIKIAPLDQTIEMLYDKERKLTSIISLFSIVAIMISLVGVFGLVVFEVQYRRKEIALRKVHGATVASIPLMINKKFIYITALSAVIAIPTSYYFVGAWVRGFAYRTPLHWWVAPAAVAIVLAITITIVTIQTIKAATENPIKSLKSE